MKNLILKPLILFFTFSLITLISLGQKKVNINQSISDYRGNSVFYIANTIPNIKFNPLLDYYWFLGNEIHSTKGAIGGKPLNGSFITYYLDNNLKEKGNYYYGLKNGQWIFWFSNGNLHKIENYYKGILNGKYMLYNDKNLMLISGEYKNNLKHGKWTSFKNSHPLETYNWRYGVLDGKFMIDDSIKTIKGRYSKGSLDGKYTINYRTSNKDTVVVYKKGIEISRNAINQELNQLPKRDTIINKKTIQKDSIQKKPHSNKNEVIIIKQKKNKPSIEPKKIEMSKDTLNHKKKSFWDIFRKKSPGKK